MRQFSKSHKLDHVCYDIRGPVLEKASEMESAGTKILKLNIGNPAPFNFSAPDEIIHDMIYTLRDAICRMSELTIYTRETASASL